MKNVINLENKRILIAGASSGIGAETARLCSELGAEVILVARREEKLQEVLSGLSGEGHRYYVFDLSRIDEIEDFIKGMIAETGPLDGFVHSAGYNRRALPLRMLKPASLREAMDVYFNSFVEITRCITKRNCYAPGLSIVGISSIFSTIGAGARTAYCTSKSAMNAAVRCFAKELAAYGIRANTVSPGMTETERLTRFQSVSGGEQEAQAFMGRQYLGFGQPIDIANTIAFLLSDSSRMITGTNINVDGGLLSS